MKRVAATLGILLMVAFFAAPVFGCRGDRSGGWSRGPGNCGQGGGWYGNAPQNQSDELYDLEQNSTTTLSKSEMKFGISIVNLTF